MGLYGMMRTSVSGMAAQANRLSTVADNIANSSTTGYKRASTEFSSLVLESGGSAYELGSVETRVRIGISEQGTFKFTTSVTDLAVKGNGFFLVNNESGQTYLTRAGSFVKDGNGDLVNAAGYRLMGYSLAPGAPPPVANGTAGLEVVNIGALALPVGSIHGGQPVRQSAFQRRDRNRSAVRQCRYRRLHGEDLARHLRQSRQRGDARRVHDQDGSRNLGGGGLQSG